jgi:hypothetical protein
VRGTRGLALFEDFVEDAEEGEAEGSSSRDIGISRSTAVRNDAIDDLL